LTEFFLLRLTYTIALNLSAFQGKICYPFPLLFNNNFRHHMLHHRLFAACISVVLLLAPSFPSPAQPQDSVTVGLGASINSLSVAAADTDAGSVSLTPFSVSIPITAASFRVEPELGFFRARESTGETSQTRSVLTVGTGIFSVLRKGDAQLLLGGRVGLRRRASSTEFRSEEESTSATDVSVGPAIGGEYYIGDHFSMGVEARFLYINLGTSDEAPDDFSRTRLRTSGVASFRFHF
jgi:hypothetical protein